MKRLQLLIGTLLLALIIPINVYAYENAKIYIDAARYLEDTQIPIIDGRVMVPLSSLSEIIGYEVQWNAKYREVEITSSYSDRMKFYLYLGDNTLYSTYLDEEMGYMNDSLKIDAYPRIINERTYVPLNVLLIITDTDVKWDKKNKSVIIDTGVPKVSEVPEI